MGSTRRSYTPEYKASSVAFVIDGGRPVAEVARNIGVHEMTLGKWVKVARAAAASGISPDAPLGESEPRQPTRLGRPLACEDATRRRGSAPPSAATTRSAPRT